MAPSAPPPPRPIIDAQGPLGGAQVRPFVVAVFQSPDVFQKWPHLKQKRASDMGRDF